MSAFGSSVLQREPRTPCTPQLPSTHGAAVPDHAYAPQHIPITECNAPQQTSFKGFKHKDLLHLEVVQPNAFYLGGRVA